MTSKNRHFAVEFFDPKRNDWMYTYGFDNIGSADEVMRVSAQAFSGPDHSRLRVRDMDTDAVLRDKIVICRPARDGEAATMFDTGNPDHPFLRIVFEWHSVH